MEKSSLQTILNKIKDNAQQHEVDKDNKIIRKNTVLIGGHFDLGVQKQLKILSAEEGKTHQALIREALDLLFIRYGKKSLNK